MLQTLEKLADDPILGLLTAYRKDPNPRKIDLGVGVYKDENGHTPVFKCVKRAEQIRFETEDTKTYMGPLGVVGFNEVCRELVFGKESAAVDAGRIRTVQTPGGTGALRVAGDLIRRARPNAVIWLPDPTWSNHNALFDAAGLRVETFPYYDRENSSLLTEDMLAALGKLGPDDVVLLHGCCHNPSGVDPSPDEWRALVEVAVERGFMPLIDIAYQGFCNGLDEDALGVRLLADAVPEMIVANSCSKNFGMYRERCGAISVLGVDADAAAASESVINNITRGLYSMPPVHGPWIVDVVLRSPELTAQWHAELAVMRDRINGLRRLLVERIRGAGIERDFSFIEHQRGMYSFLGITPAQVQEMRDTYGIYMTKSTRISVAGFSRQNVDHFVQSLAAVL